MNDTTDITIILDRSGSMARIRTDVIGGFNSFLADQRKLPDLATITLVQFDHDYEVMYRRKKVQTAPDLTEETFVPRGNTALYDAMGRAISDVGDRYASLREADRPGRVIFVVLTDGEENASREYKRAQLAAMVKVQREKYAWEFVFIGANQDAFLNGAAVGVLRAANFAADARGTQIAFDNMSVGITSYRSGRGYES